MIEYIGFSKEEQLAGILKSVHVNTWEGPH